MKYRDNMIRKEEMQTSIRYSFEPVDRDTLPKLYQVEAYN
jgi:hypothetical protein